MNNYAREVAESVVETVHIIRPHHLNTTNRLFGGILMQWIDEVAALVAKRHSRSTVTTASVDHLVFLKGVNQQETVCIYGKVTYVGRTSMEVRVDSFVETINREKVRINSAYITMVALDREGIPTPVPGLILKTEEEKVEWEKGRKRRSFRNIRQEEDI